MVSERERWEKRILLLVADRMETVGIEFLEQYSLRPAIAEVDVLLPNNAKLSVRVLDFAGQNEYVHE